MDASGWNQRYGSADRVWSAGPNLYVADRLGPVEPGTGLDLACGEGRNAIWLAGRGWKMTGVDFSEVAIERARSSSDDVDFVLDDVRTWEPAGRFGLVLIAYLHLEPEEMEGVVRQAAGWLEPGGEIFMIGHDRSNLDDGHGGPQVPEVLWSVGALTGWLDGLVQVEAQVVRRPVHSDDGLVYARDTLVRARAG